MGRTIAVTKTADGTIKRLPERSSNPPTSSKSKAEPSNESKKMTANEARLKVDELQEKINQYGSYGYCYMCDTHKAKDKFYTSTDPNIKSGVTPICKECARKIALRVDKNGEEHNPTKESVQMALRYLNKPYLNRVWDASIQESEALITGRIKTNVWTSYIKNISMGNYVGMTYFDSDFFKVPVVYADEQTPENQIDNKDILESFEQNKEDVIRLLGYDPFSKESLSDQPFLYANLIGYLDASSEANDDRMRVSSIIEIVKGFSHIEKINDIIARLMSDYEGMDRNIVTIKNMEETKSKITNSILGLAKDSGISLNHSKNASKGENTWTGKIRKLKDINLRDAEMNLYDTEYSDGLQQVAEISNAAIIKQIRLDENDYTDMLAQQRDLIKKYKQIADEAEERARILLRENSDLKETVKANS